MNSLRASHPASRPPRAMAGLRPGGRVVLGATFILAAWAKAWHMPPGVPARVILCGNNGRPRGDGATNVPPHPFDASRKFSSRTILRTRTIIAATAAVAQA